MIGQHHCKSAFGVGVHLPQAIAIALDEVCIALEESFADLTDAQAWAFVIPVHNNVAWIVMHCLHNLDEYAVGSQTGRRVMQPERRWDLWDCRPDERPTVGDAFPTVAEMQALLRRVREAAAAAIEKADEQSLTSAGTSGPTAVTPAEFYMRTLSHTQAHVRQIWLIRGALGLTDGAPRRWPQQHWA